LKTNKDLVEKTLTKYFSNQNHPKTLVDSMKYSLFAGGKRIRPIITIAANKLCGGDIKKALPVACAIEMIHSYSLIHDDLPSMDDDDLRRGKLTNHKVFGEAMAILAGDTLMTHAYYIIAKESLLADVPSKTIVQLIEEVGFSTGISGMAGGQVLDLEAEDKEQSLEELQEIHRLKTGALIKTSIICGALTANANEKTIKKLSIYADHIGLLFQIVDDILDVTSSTEDLGKPSGSDEKNNKTTYVKLLGLEKAKTMAEQEAFLAKEALSSFGDNAAFFHNLISYLENRSN
jgi:geranylgeranyl diphosphate synthase, type II